MAIGDGIKQRKSCVHASNHLHSISSRDIEIGQFQKQNCDTLESLNSKGL